MDNLAVFICIILFTAQYCSRRGKRTRLATRPSWWRKQLRLPESWLIDAITSVERERVILCRNIYHDIHARLTELRIKEAESEKLGIPFLDAWAEEEIADIYALLKPESRKMYLWVSVTSKDDPVDMNVELLEELQERTIALEEKVLAF